MTDKDPTFSVIMPVYNCREWIRDAVVSVLDQDDHDFELIIVDDASTDDSVSAIADLIADDRRLHLIQRTTNGNAASARNTGLEVCKGRLIAFLDADDLWNPTRLSAHRAVFEAHPDAALVFSDFQGFGGNGGDERPFLTSERHLSVAAATHLDGPYDLCGGLFRIYRCRKSISTFIALNYNVLFMHSVTLSRKALDAQASWFPKSLNVCEDLEFFLRVIESGSAIFLPENLAWYRRRPKSLTALEEGFFRGMVQFHSDNLERCRARFTTDEVGQYQARIAQLRMNLAWQLRLKNATAESRRQCWLAFRESPNWATAKVLAKSLAWGYPGFSNWLRNLNQRGR